MGISKMRVEFTVNYLVDRGVITEIIKLIPVGESQPM
jgi:outer membrane protein OmpA-like peptidoglycan-associated protein